MKKRFDPKDWRTERKERKRGPTMPKDANKWQRVSDVVAKIEAMGVDITQTYENWRNVGFAMADELGERGRELFLRVSVFYQRYNEREADRQYDRCMKAQGHGVTIGTFYHLASLAGVDIKECFRKKNDNERPEKMSADKVQKDLKQPVAELPTTNVDADKLPTLLGEIVRCGLSREDADLLLLGSMVTMSACLKNVSGVYADRTVYPNLYLFVTAQASAGKGRLALCRRLVNPIHRQLREETRLAMTEYEQQMKVYQSAKNKEELELPQEPPQKMLIIPANASSTSVFQILDENDSCGLLFETEGDTLAQTFRSEHGNYSDGFRKAFHHEPISYVRRKNREHVEILAPQLSAVMSGTPRQISALIPDAENGLFSRFIFYCLNMRLEWLNVFAKSGNMTLDRRFDTFAERLKVLYVLLEQQKDEGILFEMTEGQQKVFNKFFEGMQEQMMENYGIQFIGSVRRMGLIAYRFAMILSTLRLLDDVRNSGPKMTCNDVDFETSLQLALTLIKHSAYVFGQLTDEGDGDTVPPKAIEILEALGERFTRQEFFSEAQRLNVVEPTAKRYITKLKKIGEIDAVDRGVYVKVIDN